MSSILIAESGSTKTDWVLLHNGKKKKEFRSEGINPYLQTPDQMLESLQREINPGKAVIDEVYFYGAGNSLPQNRKLLKGVLKKYFKAPKTEVHEDMLAAARGLCLDKKGLVCILGTGSNACFFDGKKIRAQLPSLGFIAGDEGSGNYMGKRILQYYAYNTFDGELRASFEQLIGNDITQIIQKLYHQPFPNRYLASFVVLLTENRGHYMVENIIEDCLNDFFHHQIFKHRQSWKYPIYFTGSIAHGFADTLRSLCNQYELEMGRVLKTPLEGLIDYHKR